ncbi:hypothetical protein, partial [Agrobacterium sp. a22-2]|uniref:hypothetical protein n=1 Tax=Agrobacterium sp. a22-2 TaxID=2283840 RepID=UPI001AEED4E5
MMHSDSSCNVLFLFDYCPQVKLIAATGIDPGAGPLMFASRRATLSGKLAGFRCHPLPSAVRAGISAAAPFKWRAGTNRIIARPPARPV